MTTAEELGSSMLKRDCVEVINTLSRGVYICTQGSRWSGSKEHDRFDAGEERYAAVWTGYEGSERNGTKPIGSPCGTV